MLNLILRTAAATAMFAAAAAVTWRMWARAPRRTLAAKLAVGLAFGLCTLLSCLLAPREGPMLLTVQDLGPLAAGLFFDPVSGVLAGLVGGFGRYLMGSLGGVASFTRLTGSLSAVAAGLLSAALSRTVFRDRHPSGVSCFFLGAGVEVLHMYSAVYTFRSGMSPDFEAVFVCAPVMIPAVAFGLAACSLLIARRKGLPWAGWRKVERKRLPLAVRFQRWLLAVTVGVFVLSFSTSTILEYRTALSDAEMELALQLYFADAAYAKDHDLERLRADLDDHSFINGMIFVLVDTDQNLQLTALLQGDSAPLDPSLREQILAHAGTAEHFDTALYGAECLSMSRHLGGPYYVMASRSYRVLEDSLKLEIMENLFLFILLSMAVYLLIDQLVHRLIVQNLARVNTSLNRIAAGDLNEVVAVEESEEFSVLSEDINKTVTALRELGEAEKERIAEELRMAAEIQNAVLPKNFRLDGDPIDLCASMTPARTVGGDFYDFFHIRDHQLALAIADVSGKGIPAAMFMMRARTAIRNFAKEEAGPARILEQVNNALCEDNDTNMFVTVWLGILDLRTGLLRCSNGGHEYPALKSAGQEYALLHDSHGFVLGGFENVPMEEYEIRLNPGDRVFVYTDGIPEAENEERQQFGLERMTACLNLCGDVPQRQILDRMLAGIRDFAGGAEQSDDITMLGFTYAPPENGETQPPVPAGAEAPA